MSDRYKGAILSPTAPTVTPQSAGGVYTLSQQTQYQGQGVWPSAFNNPINNSLRFRSSASAYLNRTFSTPTNNKLFTWSGWVKRSQIGVWNDLFGAGGSNGFGFNTAWNDNGLAFFTNNISGDYFYLVTTQVFRDPSAWYHIVLAIDTTQATASNRAKLYVNGNQITAFNTAVYQSQNSSLTYNSATTHYLGSLDGSIRYLDGYMTEVNFIDGLQLTPSSFGTTDAYGIWQPIPYTGTYGTNGFYLKFTDNSALTTSSNVGLGKDFSGNGNYWVTNNISITAGSTYDSMVDVPTNTNSNTANYATLNPLQLGSGSSTSNGNLSGSNLNSRGLVSTIHVNTGKFYWEVNATSGNNFTIGVVDSTLPPGIDIFSSGYNTCGYYTSGDIYLNGSVTTTVASYTSGDIIGVALNCDTNQVTFYKNNTSLATITLTSGISWKSFMGTGASTPAQVYSINFGQQPFAYTPPTGFNRLNTYNLPTPTILAGIEYMGATIYDGNSTSNRVITTGGGCDFVWIKRRNSTTNNILFDVLRGAGDTLYSNLTNAAAANGSYYVQTFGSTSFTLGTGGDAADNITGGTYVAWNWKANGAGVSNTQGTITSTVSANTTAGFSVVTYTGNGTNGSTVGHGLGVAPSMIIVKSRSTTGNWITYHTSTGINQYLYLNSTNASATTSPTWGVSSTTFTLQQAFSDYNTNGTTYVAYCFAAVSGYSAFGSYTGNGSTDGPFVYTGFRPRFILCKRTDSSTGGNWTLIDSARNSYNVTNLRLYSDTSDAESSSSNVYDLLSNGFKLRQPDGSTNNISGATYIYMAFAENPFKIARGR